MPATTRTASFLGLFLPFALIGLVATLLAIYATLGFKHRQIDNSLAELGRTSVEALTLTMSKTLMREIDTLVGQTRDLSETALRRHPAVVETHARLADAVEGTKILKIKIFDVDGRTIYSPVEREIGVATAHPNAIPEAKAGRSTTIVYPPRSVNGFGGVRDARSVVATYTPIFGSDGSVRAVFEVYVDTSLEHVNIEANLRRFDTTVASILLTLYTVLLAIVWRAARGQSRQREALDAERARFADFSDIAAGWIWETDAEHRLTFVTEGIRAIGVDPQSRYGQRSNALEMPTGVDGDGPKLAQIMDAQREFRDVYIRLERPDRSEAWIARSGRPRYGKDGEFLGYRGADRDETRRVVAERELRAADATKSRLLDALDRARISLELAVETSQMGWWEIDGRTGEQYWSPRARQIWGQARDTQPTYENFLGALHPDDARERLDVLTLPQGILIRNYRVLHKDGEIRHVREHTRVDRNPDGSLLRITGSILDVTDIQNLRATAEQAKATLDSALDSIQDGFSVYDAEDRMVLVNDAYRRMVPEAGGAAKPGTPFETVLRATIGRVLSDGTEEEREALHRRRLAYRRDPHGKFELVLANGRIIEISETRTQSGFTTSLLRDVTDERQAAAELGRAKAAAEKANRAKSIFLATMSHEIRTPMNGVLGTVELLGGTRLDARQRAYVEAVERSASALLSILNDILDYSKLEAGDLKLEDIAFDPASVLRQTAQLLTPGAAKKGLTLACRVDDGTPEFVSGDPTRVRQILFNLIGNAIKFTERGRVEATLEAHGEALVFRVADTGIGIDPGVLPRLFDRFSQADETITRRFGGTGLGLAIARDLARAMGGDIDVASRPGEGSTFALSFPIRVPAAAPAAAERPRIALRPARSLDLLVAEDNEVNRMVVHDMLERMGHTVVFAIDGREAVAKARDRRYDAILMDAQMPEIDGVEATRWIRILPEPFGSVPIVALTANAMRGDREAYLAVGMNDYLAKPVRGPDLAAALERVTGVARFEAADPAFAYPSPAPAADATAKGLAALVANLRQDRAVQ